jgi:hypothetical protein
MGHSHLMCIPNPYRGVKSTVANKTTIISEREMCP